MLLRCSVNSKTGEELLTFENENFKDFFAEPKLTLSFLKAIQSFSQTVGTEIQHIRFSNMIYYFQPKDDHILNLLFDEEISDEKLNEFFTQISLISDTAIQTYRSKNEIKKEDITEFQNKLKSLTEPIKEVATKIQTKTVKIAMLGFCKAGKSSIKNKFLANWSIDQINNIQPTIGLEIKSEFSHFLKQNIIVWDFGGQSSYHKDYFNQKNLWENMLLLIYVVDVQDLGSLQSSVDYLKNIVDKIKEINNELPKITLFLHKYDPELRDELEENIQLILLAFKEYLPLANVHLTSIYDQSSNLAFIKTLYYSIPGVVLYKIFEMELFRNFNKLVLPNYTCFRGDIYNQITEEEKNQISKDAILIGKRLGNLLQKNWLKAIIGDWEPKEETSSKKIKLKHKYEVIGNDRILTIENWKTKGFDDKLIIDIWDGLLEGILKTINTNPPKRIESTDQILKYKVTL